MPNGDAHIVDRPAAHAPATSAFLPPTPGSGSFRSRENVPVEMKSPLYRLPVEGTVAKKPSRAMHGHHALQGMNWFGSEAGEAIAVDRRGGTMREGRVHFVSRAVRQRHARDTARRPMQYRSPETMARFEPCHRKVIVPLIDEVRTG